MIRHAAMPIHATFYAVAADACIARRIVAGFRYAAYMPPFIAVRIGAISCRCLIDADCLSPP